MNYCFNLFLHLSLRYSKCRSLNIITFWKYPSFLIFFQLQNDTFSIIFRHFSRFFTIFHDFPVSVRKGPRTSFSGMPIQPYLSFGSLLAFPGPWPTRVIFSHFSHFPSPKTPPLSSHPTYVTSLGLWDLFEEFRYFSRLFQIPKKHIFPKNHIFRPPKTFRFWPSFLDFSHFSILDDALRHPIFISFFVFLFSPPLLHFHNLYCFPNFYSHTIFTRNNLILHDCPNVLL